MEPTLYREPLLTLEFDPILSTYRSLYRLYWEDATEDYLLSLWNIPRWLSDDWPLLEPEHNLRYRVPNLEAEEMLDVLRYSQLPLLTPRLDYQWRDGIVQTLTIYHPNLCRSQYIWNELPSEWSSLNDISTRIRAWAK